jgi:hypothetical protein
VNQGLATRDVSKLSHLMRKSPHPDSQQLVRLADPAALPESRNKNGSNDASLKFRSGRVVVHFTVDLTKLVDLFAELLDFGALLLQFSKPIEVFPGSEPPPIWVVKFVTIYWVLSTMTDTECFGKVTTNVFPLRSVVF